MSELESSVGRIIQYYDQGWRYGYLVSCTEEMAAVQPIAPGPLARRVTVKRNTVQQSAGQSVTYPTLESYVASRPVEAVVVKVAKVPTVFDVEVAHGTVLPAHIMAANVVTANKEALRTGRAEALASDWFKAAMVADIAARPAYTVCKHGHSLTDPQHIHTGDLKRTGKRTCYTCWLTSTQKSKENKA